MAHGGGPSLSGFLLEHGTREQLREFCAHRSAYQLKEADPHSFGIPRVQGAAKAAMVEIQYDEYGAGDPAQMHSALFATTMSALGLDATYGAYLDHLPGVTLATVNLVTMFGLHRRWRAALVGHLAVFELTSVEPMARYSAALRRFGIDADGRRFYDVHVAADVVHERIAKDELVAGLVDQDPTATGTILFGVLALAAIERGFLSRLLNRWAVGETSLLHGLPHTAVLDLPSAVLDLPSAVPDLPSVVLDLPSAVLDLPSAVLDLPTDTAVTAGRRRPSVVERAF